jgi:hypothetical protein
MPRKWPNDDDERDAAIQPGERVEHMHPEEHEVFGIVGAAQELGGVSAGLEVGA